MLSKLEGSAAGGGGDLDSASPTTSTNIPATQDEINGRQRTEVIVKDWESQAKE